MCSESVNPFTMLLNLWNLDRKAAHMIIQKLEKSSEEKQNNIDALLNVKSSKFNPCRELLSL
jgi:hypothetical protein